jgi:hypothetical protein
MSILCPCKEEKRRLPGGKGLTFSLESLPNTKFLPDDDLKSSASAQWQATCTEQNVRALQFLWRMQL